MRGAEPLRSLSILHPGTRGQTPRLCAFKNFERASPGCLVNAMLGPQERTPSREGQDVFSVCDVLPFPNFEVPPKPEALALVWLRTNPQEDIAAGRAAANGFVDAIQEVVAQDRQRKPVRAGEVGRVFGIDAPAVGAGRPQHDIVADGQAQDANRWRRRRNGCDRQNLGTEAVDRAEIGVVGSNRRNRVSNGALGDVVVLHPWTVDEKRMNRARVNGERIGLTADKSERGIRLVAINGVKEAGGGDGKIRREHGW